jgi:diguanylate cyclase
MAIPSMSSGQMRAAVTELDQALYNHEQWGETLYASLACRLPPDERDLSEDAHRKCRFGQWCYGSARTIFADHPGFAEIESEHKRMHRFAARLLQVSARGEANSVQDYEQFVSALKRLRLEIATLKRELEESLYNLDPLTGVAGRIGMLTKLREEQELVKRGVHVCAIAMIDIDRFKTVNDYYGHVVGDRVLVACARHLMKHLRPYDKVFRYGGDEFLIVLPDTAAIEGEEIVERLRKGLHAIGHEGDANGEFHVAVSAGLTVLDAQNPVEESIDQADKALFLAKAGGRDRTMLWNRADQPAAAQ